MDVEAEDRRLANKAAQEYVEALARTGKLSKGSPPKVQVVAPVILQASPDTTFVRFRDGRKIEYPCPYSQPKEGGRVYEKVTGWYVIPGKEDEIGTIEFTAKMKWTRDQTRKHRRRAVLHAVTRLQAVTEHYAPLLIAAFALASPLVASLLPANNDQAAQAQTVSTPTAKASKAERVPVPAEKGSVNPASARQLPAQNAPVVPTSNNKADADQEPVRSAPPSDIS
jgi:hypothetical protein